MQKLKRIFIVADISYKPIKMYLNAMRKLAKGFIRLGHDVEIFSYRQALYYFSPLKSKSFAAFYCKTKVDELIANQIRQYKPDIIWIGFPRVLDAKTIQRMRESAPDAVFMGGDGDPWPELNQKKMAVAKELDIIVATNDGEFLETYRKAGVPHCAFIPNMCDPDTDHRYEVGPEWKTDILWTGTAKHHANSSETFREELVTELSKRNDCSLYGCFGRPQIGGIDYLYAISGARIGVSVNAANSVRLYHSDRLAHYLACGTFVLAKRVPDTNLLFKDGEHLRYFDSIEEFFDLAKWYLEHEDERKIIADAGMKWIHKQYNPIRIAEYVLNLVEKGVSAEAWTCEP